MFVSEFPVVILGLVVDPVVWLVPGGGVRRVVLGGRVVRVVLGGRVVRVVRGGRVVRVVRGGRVVRVVLGGGVVVDKEPIFCAHLNPRRLCSALKHCCTEQYADLLRQKVSVYLRLTQHIPGQGENGRDKIEAEWVGDTMLQT